MFRALAAGLGPPPLAAANTVLTTLRPAELSEYLEQVWSGGPTAPLPGPGGPAAGPPFSDALGVTGQVPAYQDMARPDTLDPVAVAPGAQPAIWHHLVYAYMIENTRIVEIFRRVLIEWLHGERLPNPSVATQRWIQATEQLFFGEAWAYSVRAITSRIRPDSCAMRRNAYYRLLGMDLNHGTDDGRPYPYVKAEAANRDFAVLFEALLVEAWRGYVNVTNQVGANDTDDNAIMTLVRRLREMLMARRLQGELSRVEFDSVALASWLHLTVEFDTDVVVNLTSTANGIADRLRRIGERVGLPPHSRTDAYFQLAEPMSNVLLAIQANAFPNAVDLYDGYLTADLLQIVTHWSIATGRNIKDATARQPIATVLNRAPVPTTNGNGSRIAAFLS